MYYRLYTFVTLILRLLIICGGESCRRGSDEEYFLSLGLHLLLTRFHHPHDPLILASVASMVLLSSLFCGGKGCSVLGQYYEHILLEHLLYSIRGSLARLHIDNVDQVGFKKLFGRLYR